MSGAAWRSPLAQGLCCAVMAVACASGSSAQGQKAPVGVDPHAPAEAVDAALLDCARLTYSSTEAPFTARLFMDRHGYVTGLAVTAEGQPPPSLFCPADRPLSKVVLGTGNGGSWGAAPATGQAQEVFCSAGFSESTAGCGVHTVWLAARKPPPRTSAAPRTARAAPESPTAAPMGKAPVAMHYKLSRLGSDLPVDSGLNLEHTLRATEYAISLCMHVTQPGFNNSLSMDVAATVEVDPSSATHQMPFRVVALQPASVDALLGDCVRGIAGDPQVSNPRAVVLRFAAVAEKAERPVGTYVQEVHLEPLSTDVELSVDAAARKALELQVRQALQDCLAAHPLVRPQKPGGWYSLGSWLVSGSVDTRHRQALALGGVDLAWVDIGTQPRKPEWMKPQEQCLQKAFGQEPTSAAPARLVYGVTLRSVDPAESR